MKYMLEVTSDGLVRLTLDGAIQDPNAVQDSNLQDWIAARAIVGTPGTYSYKDYLADNPGFLGSNLGTDPRMFRRVGE